MNVTFEILAEGLNFPEGPVFDQNGNFWFTELLSGNIVQFKNGKFSRFPVGMNVNGLALDKEGKFWFTDSREHTINVFDPVTARAKVILSHVAGEKLNRPNDLIFDHLGNLIISCHADGRTEPTGYLMVLERTMKAKKISTGKNFTNGITFLSDQQTMIFSETYAHRIWKAKWNAEKATIEQEEPWLEVGGPTGPDGLTTDHLDQVYVAIFGQGVVKVVNKSGEIKQEIPVPGNRPTSLIFHPDKKNELYITEAEKGLIIKMIIS